MARFQRMAGIAAIAHLGQRPSAGNASAFPSTKSPYPLTEKPIAGMRRFRSRACPSRLDDSGTPDMGVVARIAWAATQTIRWPPLLLRIENDGYLRSYGTHVLTCPRHAESTTTTPPFMLDGVGPNWAFVGQE
jgi:hypothetical protein